MTDDLQCPVDFVSINENKARLTAFFVFVLAVTFLTTGLWLIPAFLTIDFLLRANYWGKFSLLAILSDAVIKQLKIKNKPTDRAPKRFAAGVGLIFSTGILVLSLFHLSTAAFIGMSVLVIFAFLESFVGFCAGCYVYSILLKLNKRFKIN